MTESKEIISRQLGIIKQILSKTGGGEYPIEIQLELYRQVNKWLLSDKIARERKNNNSNHKNATLKQKNLLDSLNVSYKPDIGLREASRLIKKNLEGGN